MFTDFGKKTMAAVAGLALTGGMAWAQPYVTCTVDDDYTLTLKYFDEKGDDGSVTYLPFDEVFGNELGDFTDVSGVKKVVFDESFYYGTSSVTSMANLFKDMTNLEAVEGFNYLYLNTFSLTDVSGMFNGCHAIQQIDLTYIFSGRITNMANMFLNCKSLTEINFGGFGTSTATDMSGMFLGCRSLKEINLSGFNTANVENMSDMFGCCMSLKEINLSGFNTSKVTNMQGMFAGCYGLTELDITGFDISKVTNLSNMFSSCNSLETIDVADNFTIKEGAETEEMFYHCGSLVGSNGTVSYDATKIDGSMANYKTGYFTYKAPQQYAAYKLENGVLTLKYIGTSQTAEDDYTATKIDNLFNGKKLADLFDYDSYDAGRVNKVVFDESFKKADYSINTMTDLFSDLGNLETVEGLGNLNTSELTTVNKLFYWQTSLLSVDLKGFDISNVTDMGSMFYGCSELTEVDLSGLNTSNVTDMSSLFESCDNLTKVNLSGINTSKVTTMWYMFSSCPNIKELDLTGFNTENVESMANMFSGCSSLSELNLSSFNTSNVYSMSNMFNGCSSLTELKLTGFDTKNVGSMNNMFSGCSSLTELDLSSFNCELNSSYEMFSGCSKLVTIFVSDNFSVTSYGFSDNMFSGCTSLVGSNKTVSYKSDQTDGTMANYTTGYLTYRAAPEPTDPTAVKTLGADTLSGATEYYDLMGRKMAAPSKGSMVIVRKNGKSQLAINK